MPLKRIAIIQIALGMTILLSNLSYAEMPVSGGDPASVKASGNQSAASSQKTKNTAVTADGFLDAVRSGSLKKVKACLDEGIDINVQNQNGESAMHLVRDPILARYLIRRGAGVHLTEKHFGMTPLFFQEVKIAGLLVAAGANVNARSHDGNTPLIWFAYGNYLEGVKYLISVGADMKAVNRDGHTVMDIAQEFGGPEMMDYLKKAGAGKARTK